MTHVGCTKQERQTPVCAVTAVPGTETKEIKGFFLLMVPERFSPSEQDRHDGGPAYITAAGACGRDQLHHERQRSRVRQEIGRDNRLLRTPSPAPTP